MSLDMLDLVLRRAVAALPSRWRSGGRRVLLVESSIFWCDLDLPDISGFRRRQAVMLQLDRLSPIRPDRAAIDIVSVETAAGGRRDRLYVARRADLAPALSDLDIDVIGVEGHEGVDFLQGDPVRRRRRLTTLGAGLAVLLLTLTVPPLLAIPFLSWGTRLAERDIAGLAPIAHEVRDLRDRLAFLEAEAQLGAARQGRLTRTELLEGLARRLPDDAWVTDLSFDGSVVHVVGHAVDAGRLPTAIEAGGQLRNVRFNRPITVAPDGKEEFDLIADEAGARS